MFVEGLVRIFLCFIKGRLLFLLFVIVFMVVRYVLDGFIFVWNCVVIVFDGF